VFDTGDDTASALLKLDVERAARALDDYLQHLYALHSARGVLIGLSGGLDSAVLAALAVRSLGAGSVHAVYVFDRDNESGNGPLSATVASRLGIELDRERIGSGPGAPVGMTLAASRMVWRSPALNRFAVRLYRSLAGETPFLASLRAGQRLNGGRELKSARLRFAHRHAEELFYERHLYRRRVLESRAEASGRLLLGGANRSEWEVGWFVKGGVDDLPYQPLVGFYKTQVRQLARFLEVPREVRQQAPSADMMAGVDDEFAMGITYEVLDVALEHLAGGLSREAAESAGVRDEDLRAVSEMKALSEWKRGEQVAPSPPDGGAGGGLRAA